MLSELAKVKRVYLACGYTDLRKSIDGLAHIVQDQFHLDPFSNSLFLFCGRRRDRMKALLWERDGFLLLFSHIHSSREKDYVSANDITFGALVRVFPSTPHPLMYSTADTT